MRVLVCGGRNFHDFKLLSTELDKLLPNVTAVIHGDQMGADRLAGLWAQSRGIPVTPFPADWQTHGYRAGPVRNLQMIRDGKPDRIVAFPGGPGTANMIRLARVFSLPVDRIVSSDYLVATI